MSYSRFVDKVVIVTGAGSGLYRTSTTLSGFASINLAGFLLPVLLSFQCFFFAVTISCKMNHRGMVY